MPALVTLWVAGYFFFPTNKLHYQFFLLIFCLGGAWLWSKNNLAISWNSSCSLLRFSAAFVTFYLLSLLWSDGTPLDERVGEIKSVLYLIIFSAIFAYSLKHDGHFLSKVLKMVLLAAALALLLNVILFYYIQDSSISARFHGVGRTWSPLWMAALYGAVSIVSVGILTSDEAHITTRQRYWLSFLAVVFFIAVLATQSRTAIAATVFVTLITIFSANSSYRLKLFNISVMMAVLLVFISLSLSMLDRMVDRGQSQRLNIWQGAAELIIEKPLFGYGAGSDVQIDTEEKKGRWLALLPQQLCRYLGGFRTCWLFAAYAAGFCCFQGRLAA
jgi:O-antigen ligase